MAVPYPSGLRPDFQVLSANHGFMSFEAERRGAARVLATDSFSVSAPYRKTTLVKGVPTTVRCLDVEGQTFALEGGLVRTASLEDEWFDDVRDPERVVEALRAARGAR